MLICHLYALFGAVPLHILSISNWTIYFLLLSSENCSFFLPFFLLAGKSGKGGELFNSYVIEIRIFLNVK